MEGWGGEKINDANEKLETKQINKWIEESRANLDSMMCTIFFFILMMIRVLLLISSFVKINKGAFEMGTQKSSLNSIIV